MEGIVSYTQAAMERAMKVQGVILRAMAKKITWWQAAEIIVPANPTLFSSLYTCSTSPSRATISYNTGLTKNPMKRREMRPATMTMANGLCVSDPMPVERAAGNKPRQATRAVIMIDRKSVV